MMKVKEIMTKDVVTISKEATIQEAEKILATKTISGLVVVENDVPIAVVDENDVIRGLVHGKKKIKEIMGLEFIAISPLTKFPEITSYLKKQRITRFTVVENGHLVGLITETDIIESIRDFTKFDQVVQETILVIFGLATAFFLFYFSPLGILLFA